MVERRRNPEHFGGSAVKGIGSGFWWSAVTMTTVGYGDKAPVTFAGRLIGLVWMFAAIIIISSFTAAIAASLTVSGLSGDIEGLNDLPKVRVAAVTNSTGSSFLDDHGIGHRTFPTAQEAMSELAEGQVDAVVYDAPMMQYLALNRFEGDVVVLRETFDVQYYGIALPRNSPLRESINRALLEHAHGAEWKRIVQRYVGS
jgi:ABC-type amino acid transport substrate-binding protein